MTFNYPVLSDEQIEAQRKTLEPGVYQFEVIDAESGISKNNNPMITLTLKVWDAQGNEFSIRDYLVGSAAMAFKIKHFWESVGKPEKYELGSHQDYEYKNQSGMVKTKSEKEKDGDRVFPRVADYVASSAKKSLPSTITTNINDIPDDDIPF